MIDIHTHILPELDDGARSLDESIQMGLTSAADGIRIMVATPHAHDSLHLTHEPGVIRQKIEELNKGLEGKLEVVIGCELRFTHAVVSQVCVDKSAPTINGGPYVLIEFPHAVVPAGSERAVFELMNNGIKPIVAHPERNHQLMAEPGRFHRLVDMGVLGQLDSGSITGQFGKKVLETARIMTENGLIHVIASDCHNTRNRLPGLSSALAATSELIGEEYARMMVQDNPEAIINGKPVPFRPIAVEPRKKRSWLFFKN